MLAWDILAGVLSPTEQATAQARAARNHADWFAKLARASGHASGRTHGLTWAGEGTRQLLFPEIPEANASAAIDAFLDECRSGGRVNSVGCWSLVPAQPVDLGARVLARGFEWGWRPHWMRLALSDWDDALSRDEHTYPGVEIGVENLHPPIARSLEERSTVAVLAAERLAAAGTAWHIGARYRGRLIGHVAVSVCDEDASAGIYDCAVAKRMRRRGVGTALTAAACRIARAHGCVDVLLNATDMGAPVYRRLGFESAGFGQTWWLHPERMAAQISDPQVRLVEAIGAGRVEELADFIADIDLNSELPCGLTPVEVAVRTNQAAAADWLVSHGASLDVLSCWDLGWKLRLNELLAHDERR